MELMAVLEFTNRIEMSLNDVNEWTEYDGLKPVTLPRIFYQDGEPWIEANRYSVYLLGCTSGNNPKTITSKMNHLKAYASWLEENKIDWKSFPKKQKDRCLFKYRGYLIDSRNKGILAPSTITARMGVVIQFYRYAQREFLLDYSPSPWEDKVKSINFHTNTGFSRTLSVLSSELSIPNRKTKHSSLEDGLLPITAENRDLLLKFLSENSNNELYLMCLIGFYTGARSETIRTLTISSLEYSSFETTSSTMKKVNVGPGTGIKTKNDVRGQLIFPELLISLLLKYATSSRRLSRQAKAARNKKDVLFLSIRGNVYSENTFTKLFSDLRKKMISSGYTQFSFFKFHQSRATFGTSLMSVALDNFTSHARAICFVKERMLHKSDSTTWKYITFIEGAKSEEVFQEEFFKLFIGKLADSDKESLIDKLTF